MGTKLIDRSFAGLPNPVPLLAASPSRSINILGTTGSDFEGGAFGFSRSWSRITITLSGNPATALFARSMPSTINAPEAPPSTSSFEKP